MMKSLAFATLILFGGATGAAYADHHHDVPGADWITKADLLKKMEDQGYSSVVAKADDGHWEGEAVRDGHIIKFHADAHSGDITMTRPKTGD
jgi:hypothetical protein